MKTENWAEVALVQLRACPRLFFQQCPRVSKWCHYPPCRPAQQGNIWIEVSPCFAAPTQWNFLIYRGICTAFHSSGKEAHGCFITWCRVHKQNEIPLNSSVCGPNCSQTEVLISQGTAPLSALCPHLRYRHNSWAYHAHVDGPDTATASSLVPNWSHCISNSKINIWPVSISSST